MGTGRGFSLRSLFARTETKNDGPRQTIGGSGEEIAAAFLRKSGFVILDRNYRKRFGEIDIVATEGETLVFVEVKTRRSSAYGSPLEAVDARKRKRMTRAAQDYLSSRRLHGRPARFDVVAVRLQGEGPPQIDHLRNAFDLEE